MTKTWLRVQNNIYRMRKVALLSDADFRAWIYLLCLASERDGNGVLPEIEDVAFALRLGSDNEAVALIERLVERELIDRKPGGKRGVNFAMHDWDQWQYISKTSGEEVPKVSSRTRATTDSDSEYIQTHTHTQTRPRGRGTREQGGDDDKNREDKQPQLPMPSMAEPPVRPINENDEETQSENSAAPPPPKLATRQAFEKTWEVYWGIPGNPSSSKARAWEIYQNLSNEEQDDANVGVVLWRLELNGMAAGFAKPDPTRKTKIKFLENWLAEAQWKQFNITDNPQLRLLVS